MTTTQGEMRPAYPDAGETYRYRMEEQDGYLTFNLEDAVGAGLKPAPTMRIDSHEVGEGLCRTESGQTLHFAWAWVGAELHLWLDGALYVFQRAETAAGSGRRRGGGAAGEGPGDVLAPMPGAVLEVLVSAGDRVERNQTVVVMESMKMELVITAPHSGVVRRVAVAAGQQVDRGMRLLELAPESGAAD